MFSAPGPIFTAADDVQLRLLNGEGKPDPLIAKIMGRTRRQVAHRRRSLGLLAVEFRFVWTAKDDACLRRLWKAGITGAGISRIIGVARTSVRERAKILGLPAREYLTPPRPEPAPDEDTEERSVHLDRAHVAACLAAGGFPVLDIARYRRRAA